MFQLILKTYPSAAQIAQLQLQDPRCRLETINEEVNLFCSPTCLDETTLKITNWKIPYRIVGTPNALVCIFEFFQGVMGWPEKFSKGVSRVTEVEPRKLMVDMTASNLAKGHYTANVHEFGNFAKGPDSCGQIIQKLQEIEVEDDGKVIFRVFVDGLLHEWIGRSILIRGKNDFVGGILARSAGIFENKKRVCDCTGKTIWEE